MNTEVIKKCNVFENQNKAYLKLYKPEYYGMFRNDPDIRSMELQQTRERSHRLININKPPMPLEKKLEKIKRKQTLYASGAGLCAGLIFVLGIVGIVGFILFAFCYKSVDKDIREQQLEHRKNNTMGELYYWQALCHAYELRVAIVKKAIGAGIIKSNLPID